MKEDISIDYLLLGNRIRMRRTEKNFTQAQLAEMVNCDVSYLSRIENGKSKPSLEILYRLAIKLEVGFDYFFSDDGHIFQNSYLSERLAKCTPEMGLLVEALIDDVIKYIGFTKND